MAEDFGVEDRGHFYDPVGALRDVVVNHLMQVVSATAMEPPAGGDPATIKDSPARRVSALVTANPAQYVRGQYDGYLKTEGVAAIDHGDVRGVAPRHRQLALVRRAVLHPHGQAPARHPDRGAPCVQTSTEARLRAAPEPADGAHQIVSKARSRRRASSSSWMRCTQMTRRPEPSSAHGIREGKAARRPRPTKSCCTLPWWD